MNTILAIMSIINMNLAKNFIKMSSKKQKGQTEEASDKQTLNTSLLNAKFLI